MEICFATNNGGKLKEIKALLHPEFFVKSLSDIGFTGELPETTNTLEGNSQQKALFIWERYRIPCFSDDTGLEVRSLSGAPGVFSARYAGPEANPEKNIELLLKNLQGIQDREAVFRTVITLVLEDEMVQFEGMVEGTITTTLQGNDGFGYDPVFVPKGYQKTFAELSLEEKNKISHRAVAVGKLVKYLLNRTWNENH